ncbi:GAF domain-containing protein [Cupriavidus sp. SW-Y-13]|uniref:GAF domain-containing protein n=1 Tax=Cupriavidus sp. SW-Y-13 TaxID=2653854 RepID=UPI0013658383|nr:GAF domain-containing protein [Cupriavidus sp. SW-Y-13]MWL90236.1 GAF domain-containing protein [Cupriavidus sp. SW-Y-13]
MMASVDTLGHWQTHLHPLFDRLRGAATPEAVMDAVGQATLEIVGPGLLTINAWHADSGEIERLWSSDPLAYPVGGKKIKGDTAWTRQLLVRGEVFVGEGDEALAAVFDDIAVIRELGLNGVVNVPLCHGGRVIGTFNYLAGVDAWTGEDLTALRMLGQMVVGAVAGR